MAVIARWMTLFAFESALASSGCVSLPLGSPTRLSSDPAYFGAADGAADPIATPALHEDDVTLRARKGFSARNQRLYKKNERKIAPQQTA